MKVPVYERQVSDAGPVQFRQQTISSEAAVAIADKARERGNVALAYGLKNFGEGLNVLQENRDSAIVSKAVSEFTRQVTDANYNPESGFLHARGAAADGVTQRVIDSNKKIRDSVTKGMSGRQLQKFNNATDGFSRNSELTAMRYEQGAMQEYRTEEAKKSLSNLITAISVNPDMDLGAQSDLMLSISEAFHGKSDDENIRLENFKKTEQMVISGVALEIAQTDPLRAEDYLKKNGSALEPGERQALQLKIDKAALPVKAQIQAAELWKKYGEDVGAAQDYIREHYKGTEQNAYMSAFDQLASDKIHALEKAEYDAWDKTIGLIESGNRAQAKQMIDNTPWRSQHKKYQLIDAYKDKFYPKPTQAQIRAATDASIAGKIDNLIATGQFINNYPTKEAFLEEFGDGLSAKRAKHYLKMYDEGLKELTNEQIFSQVAKYCKVDARGNEEAWFKLRNRFDYELEQWRFEHGGKFPTTQEKIQIGLSMRDDVPVQSRSEIMGYKRAPKTVKRYEIPPGFVYDETVGKPVYKGPGGSVVIRYVK